MERGRREGQRKEGRGGGRKGGSIMSDSWLPRGHGRTEKTDSHVSQVRLEECADDLTHTHTHVA